MAACDGFLFYARYGGRDRILNYPVDGAGGKFRCYFRFLWFWKTMVLNRRGLQVVGNGNNMGYRKKYYLEKRGFTGNTQEYIGYDTEIVKDMAKKGTVKVVKDPRYPGGDL